MNIYEFYELADLAVPEDRSDRTLLWGWVGENSYHCYIKEGRIYCIEYDESFRGKERSILCNEDYVSGVILDPEDCDFQFCRELKLRGLPLKFSRQPSTRAAKAFSKGRGYFLEEITLI